MNSLINAFGLAYSSGKYAIGDKLLEQIKSKKIYLVIVFTGIGSSTLKRLEDKCKFYEIKLIQSMLTIEQIQSQFAGKKVAAIGFNDLNITKLIEKNINQN
ncbi:hypothetical protein STIUS_v1c04020 [Spiroplasma sp. TIUS-1]|uniref:50S ribosomal protein L7 n=1 Tax=Spiroplasma sp. TIUS-1 TaxID=216963 RepID=UPI001398A257|nr:50S ribosomal protein L7 [Spiroplasma sp. TIUS-1]QHX35956.1 hypothetical protein STIUS_v1c04020 [Spiroplasma sp. TIUS-1]